ncbi:ATP synthase subunit a [Alphaproteobacteria bacterium]|nr:ATP synthase subunit a [Alphaproteobacteria bacterium]
MLAPLHQFEIHRYISGSLGGWDVSFTNSSLFMVLTTAALCFLLYWSTKEEKLVPSLKQSACESLFEMVSGVITEQVGREERKHSPYIFTLFLFILGANLLGLLPYGFTVTSHIIVTFALACLVSLGMIVIGLLRHGWKFFRIFYPPDVPAFIVPLLVPVEIISFFTKPVSLSVRLFANMVAGHIMLKIVAGAAVFCAAHSLLPLTVFPLGVNVLVLTFELFVAILQAYVFTILSCIYLKSVIHME